MTEADVPDAPAAGADADALLTEWFEPEPEAVAPDQARDPGDEPTRDDDEPTEEEPTPEEEPTQEEPTRKDEPARDDEDTAAGEDRA
jgi:putative membrane protein